MLSCGQNDVFYPECGIVGGYRGQMTVVESQDSDAGFLLTVVHETEKKLSTFAKFKRNTYLCDIKMISL